MSRPSGTVSDRGGTGWRVLASLQGIYFLVTGLWPLVWMDGFLAVTGPKEELWLVRMVGLLAAAIGLTLLVAARRETYTVEIVVLATTSAFSFLAVDVVGWAAGVLRWTYLIDAVLQALILFAWLGLVGAGLARRDG